MILDNNQPYYTTKLVNITIHTTYILYMYHTYYIHVLHNITTCN